MTATLRRAGACVSAALVVLVGCHPAGEDDDADSDDPALVPPDVGQPEIEAWLADGHYLAWSCEATVHAAFAPSPHGNVRICQNPIAVTAGATEHPIDSAFVIEIHEGDAIAGYGVQRHTNHGHDPDSWYWYMRVPADSKTTHDATGLAADGWGLDGPARDYCGACHRMAGTGHPGHDFVWITP